MIECPECHGNTTEIKFTGPVLWATGTIEIDADGGNIVAVSPLRATQTIQAGTEFSSPGFQLECPKCHYVGPRELFKILSTCIISDKPTIFSVTTPVGVVPVLPELEQEALRIFSMERAAWEVQLTIEEMAYHV